MTWFDTARFGMFVHWGHSSQQGIELSWPMVEAKEATPYTRPMGVAEYQSTAATFDPQQWDAPALAKRAKRLGMQYAVFTTKHHDGYSMYDTQLSRFGVMHSPFRRDIVREFVDAMRAEGLRIGLYYSLIDWHHPDYPAYEDEDKPYVFGRPRRQPTDEQWERFIAFMFGQVRELLTNYGTIDVLWFDGSWERSAKQWRGRELVQMIRELQPDILINDRLPGAGDFETPEQFVPPEPKERPWETCMTINESWGYNRHDPAFKSPRQLIHTLCEVAGRGGNLLLNVSPMGDGELQPELVERLDGVEAWMAKHAASILETRPGLEPWQFYGPSTRRGDTIYCHLLMRPYESVTIRGLPIKRIRSVRCVGTGAALEYETRCAILDRWFNPDPSGEVTVNIPAAALDDYATVLAIEVAPQE
jgi:alpha-L-fucosidase